MAQDCASAIAASDKLLADETALFITGDLLITQAFVDALAGLGLVDPDAPLAGVDAGDFEIDASVADVAAILPLPAPIWLLGGALATVAAVRRRPRAA